MNNEIIISNVVPQDIVIGEGGATGISAVYVNGVDVTVGSIAYVIVPTKTSELINNSGFITSEQDPTVPFHVKQITTSDINKWNNKQDELVSGQNIKTINNQSILGNGNLDVETIYTAGTGINITDEKVISNTITSYNDLSDLPTIPTSTSQLTNDSDFVSSSALSSVAFTGEYDDLLNNPDLSEYITKYVSDLVNYYTKDFFFNILPKVSGSGTSITLDDTIKGSQMYLTLGATELSQDGTPTPDSPQTIHTISGSNKVVVNGKNLFDKYYYLAQKDNFTHPEGNSYFYFLKLDDKFKSVFTASVILTGTSQTNLVLAFDTQNVTSPSSEKRVLNIGGALNNITYDFTNASDVYLVIGSNDFNISIENRLNAMFNNYNIQLEKGNTATTYEPYTSQEADIDLGDIEYCKIGTYSDEFIRETDGTWQLKKNIGKVVLDGTETWTADTGTVGTNYKHNAKVSDLGIATPLGTTGLALSNYFEGQTVGNNSGDWGKFYLSSTFLVMTDKSQVINSASDLETWLSTHNTIIYYVLSTPTYTQITGTLAEQLENVYNSLTSEQDQTNISQVNNDLPFTISATTLKDLSSL